MAKPGSDFSIFIRAELEQNFKPIFPIGLSSDLINGPKFFVEPSLNPIRFGP